ASQSQARQAWAEAETAIKCTVTVICIQPARPGWRGSTPGLWVARAEVGAREFMGIQVKAGDVFLIPLDGKSWALGQLVSDYKGELYVAIFGQKLETGDVDPYSVVGQDPILLSLTLDSKLFHGDWLIFVNVQDNLSNFPQPAFKVRQSGVVYLESRDRTVSRPASSSEAQLLRYRSVSYPAVLAEAVQGHFGVCEWNPHYDKFHADYAYQ